MGEIIPNGIYSFKKKKVKTKACPIFLGSHFHDLILCNLTILLLSERYLYLKHNLTYNSFIYKILLKINSQLGCMPTVNLKDHDEL